MSDLSAKVILALISGAMCGVALSGGQLVFAAIFGILAAACVVMIALEIKP